MDIFNPQPITDIVWSMYRPYPIKIRSGTAMSIQVAGKNSTPTGIAHLMGLNSRSLILLILASTQLMDTTNWRHGLTPREERYGTRILSTAGQPSEGGAILDNNIVDINENYINYINSNPNIVHKLDELVVVDTGTTGHYLTPDSPCNNKQLAVIPLPIRMPNGEIITSTHTALLSKTDLSIEARKAHLFPGLNKSLL